MKHYSKLLFCLSLFFLAAPCFAESWRGITPLQTTRAEVLQILGAPQQNNADQSEYFELDEQTIIIRWARADCAGQDRIIAKPESVAPESLVYQITVKPKKPLELIEVGEPDKRPDESKDATSRRWLANDVECFGDNCTVTNSRKGFGYSTGKDGVVAVYYFPADAENKRRNAQYKPCSPVAAQK